jgi:2-dehydropantoate 2-reductase
LKIAVFGAGALGSAVGALLSTRHEVTLVCRRQHAEAVNRDGLELTGTAEGNYRPKALESIKGMPQQEMVLITVKAYDAREAVREVAPIVGPGTLVGSLQNGLRNGEAVERSFGSRAVVGVPVLGAAYLGPGEVRLSGLQEIIVGSPGGHLGTAIRMAEILSESSIPARVSASIRSEVWMKTVVNSAVNPVTALVRKENGCILRSRELMELCRSVSDEGTSAAEANQVNLGGDPYERTMQVVRATAGNRSSMLQDVERGRRTEIDEINGALVDAGGAKGVVMPVNRALWALLRSLR